MSRDELLAYLRALQVDSEYDEEFAHKNADEALLAFINDPEISEAFALIRRWYA